MSACSMYHVIIIVQNELCYSLCELLHVSRDYQSSKCLEVKGNIVLLFL